MFEAHKLKKTLSTEEYIKNTDTSYYSCFKDTMVYQLLAKN